MVILRLVEYAKVLIYSDTVCYWKKRKRVFCPVLLIFLCGHSFKFQFFASLYICGKNFFKRRFMCSFWNKMIWNPIRTKLLQAIVWALSYFKVYCKNWIFSGNFFICKFHLYRFMCFSKIHSWLYIWYLIYKRFQTSFLVL